MNDRLFDSLGESISLERIRRNAEEIHRLEGNESYANFRASTDYALRMMKESGFQQVERIALPADGKTAYFDYIMPTAWDLTGRSFIRLEDESMTMRERLIADSDRDPFNAGVWGAPTPKGGMTCEIVDYRTVGHDPESLNDKLVLMDGYSSDQYRSILCSGASGVVISDSKAGEEYPDFCRWWNGIAFTGWYPGAAERRIPIFFITPRRADLLRKRLAKGKLTAHAEANTRIYEGEIYTLTGVIPGSSSEEITMVAHMYEPFLPDDAAGGAIICEICRGLKGLIDSGKLSPLKKTLRIVLSLERYGFSQYYLDRERNRRTLAVFSFDSCCHLPGRKDLPRLKLRRSSVIQPSFIDLYLPEMFRRKMPGISFAVEPGNLSDDTFCSDDWIGIPSLWVHSEDSRYHHNAGPKFMDADWNLAVDVARVMGTLIGTLATADPTRFREIAGEIAAPARNELAERIAVVKYELSRNILSCRDAAEKIRFHTAKTVERMDSINRFCPGTVTGDDTRGLTELAEQAIAGIRPAGGPAELHGAMARAAKVIVSRLEPGTLMSLVKVPHAERRNPVMEDLLYILLDGKRSLYEAMKLYEYEMDVVFPESAYQERLETVKYLEKYGYVKIRELTDCQAR